MDGPFSSRKFLLTSGIISLGGVAVATRRASFSEFTRIATTALGIYCSSNVVQKVGIPGAPPPPHASPKATGGLSSSEKVPVKP